MLEGGTPKYTKIIFDYWAFFFFNKYFALSMYF